MKKIMVTIFLGVLATMCCFSQNNADDIVGYYLVTDIKSKDKSQMEIYRTGDGKYEAKVVWMENKAKNDQVGSVQIRNLTYDAKSKEWRQGKVKYGGDEYSVVVSVSEPGKLKLRGYLGISLFGKTMYWTKEKALRK
ncbi:DUF2147 domain-containing protein [Bacteroidales bacterium OttesenSCG-928-C03]|nr:DUF2147 domain-containing protein [Bacteroidales bacterium OttesenSCG-928-C03]MDL2325945.1 DUF2147 domain-containing protein [Bacteroidales bacterium OttesenSCG-928-A14]